MSSRPPRDSQRAKVYKAERTVWNDADYRHDDIKAAIAYVERVRASELVKRYAPELSRRPVEVGDGRGAARAKGGFFGISLPHWARTEFIILHELAHVAISRRHGINVAGHGWEFCDVYLRLVRTMLGVEAHDRLRDAFKAHGVRYRPKAKRAPLSPERRAALAEQLARARAAKQ